MKEATQSPGYESEQWWPPHDLLLSETELKVGALPTSISIAFPPAVDP